MQCRAVLGQSAHTERFENVCEEEEKNSGKPKCDSTAWTFTTQCNIHLRLSSHSKYMPDSHTCSHTYFLFWKRETQCLFVRVCMCVVTEITGDVMEHGEPQPHWLYSSETKIALLWLTTHIHASNSKYQPVDHFYKLYSIHIRDNGQSGTLWLPNITYSASMSRNPRNTVWLFWIKSPFYVWCMQLFHKV